MENTFELEIAGMNTYHPPNTAIDVPGGIPNAILIQLCTPAVVETTKGRETAAAGDCILHTPGFPRYLAPVSGAAEGFRNNWILFRDSQLEQRIGQYGILPNILLHDNEPRKLELLVTALFTEYLQADLFSAQKHLLLFEEMLIHLARQQAMPQPRQYAPNWDLLRSVEMLRLDIYSNPADNWTVSAMARSVAMSESWLNKIYKQIYHITPKRDIMLARLECAKNKLLFEGTTLRCAAVESGFQNEFYFSTVFKRETGMTPGEFRARWLERIS